MEDFNQLPIVNYIPKTEKEEKYLREIIEYEFINTETSGLILEFVYGNTKKSHKFRFFDGGKYRIPRHVGLWINDRHNPIWGWKPTGDGDMGKKFIGKKPRFQLREVFGG
jgi:hypothetical protein